MGVKRVIAVALLTAAIGVANPVSVGAAGAAPAFALASLAGPQVSLAQHRGKIVLVNFWATWCIPCRVEMPWLMDLQKTFGTDLVVLGIAMDEDGAKAVAPFVQRHGLTFPILLGNDAVANAYDVEAMPATVLIDRAGQQVSRTDGPFELKTMQRAIQALRDQKIAVLSALAAPQVGGIR